MTWTLTARGSEQQRRTKTLETSKFVTLNIVIVIFSFEFFYVCFQINGCSDDVSRGSRSLLTGLWIKLNDKLFKNLLNRSSWHSWYGRPAWSAYLSWPRYWRDPSCSPIDVSCVMFCDNWAILLGYFWV